MEIALLIRIGDGLVVAQEIRELICKNPIN
jgi:hypothetical protein